MFFIAIAARNAEIKTLPDNINLFLQNARIEVFVLHFRNLYDFLYPDNCSKHKDNIHAHHFITVPKPLEHWIKCRTEINDKLLCEEKNRANKLLAHLTKQRICGLSKEWDYVELGKEIRKCLNKFIEIADPLLLGEDIKSIIPSGPL